MKKIIVIFIVALIFTNVGFGHITTGIISTDYSDPKHSSGPTPLSPSEVGSMSYRYRVLIQKNPGLAVQVVRLNLSVLANLSKSATSISYIFGADEADNVTLILGLYTASTNSTLYYRYSDFFSNSDPGMSNFSVLCPPPGSCAGAIPAAQ